MEANIPLQIEGKVMLNFFVTFQFFRLLVRLKKVR